ncbi:MAG: hypothetical protein IPO88_04715 [Nannocystis sp.]|uniref:hypothetical protein n=1 Tax=Nannocystis sp. TaxID=1962667 RepID=UPI002427787A|nr:hypothetical protein [Nannocystis sp.]MBK9752804.1 hypothetical protein [Nannocystis sp.]
MTLAATLAATTLLIGCAEPAAPPSRPQPLRSEPPAPPPMTPEELAEARRKAGFRDDDLAGEKALAREQGGRQYVREHLAAYRGLVKALRRSVDDIDRSARRWARARDPQRAYRRWRDARDHIVADLTQRYRELRREGVDAGSTQALVERIYRQWEDVHNDLGGDAAEQERFAALISELSEGLDAAELALDEIERDEDLAPR